MVTGATQTHRPRHSTDVPILTTFDLDGRVFDALECCAVGFLEDVSAEKLVENVPLADAERADALVIGFEAVKSPRKPEDPA